MQLSPAETSALQSRRLAFELGLSDLRVQGALILISAPYEQPRIEVCPCCGYPTLERRAYHDTCDLCSWEDDGQDDARADEVWGGPNTSYSLTEARRNFIDHRTTYRPSDDQHFARVEAYRAARQDIIDVYDTLLPVVQPWTFIGALPEIERLYERRSDIAYGKSRCRRTRTERDDRHLREQRDWETWTAIAARSLPPWRRRNGPPALQAERTRVFAYFVRGVQARLREITAARRTVLDEPAIYSNSAHWSTGEDLDRSALLIHDHYAGDVTLTLDPPPVNGELRRYAFGDDRAIEQAAQRIADYFR